MPTPDDIAHMRAALALARRGLGNTWPNPSVGCVVVKDGRVVGRAVTAPGGRPHAEPAALAMAGAQARGATAYVTLEPCCHWGRTPPCTDALIQAGIARVVIAARDPDPRVNSHGIARLRAAGIVVDEGVLEAEARETTAGFHLRMSTGRPLVTLKLASTLDGRIATRAGESRWITGEPARRAAHALRGRHDAMHGGRRHGDGGRSGPHLPPAGLPPHPAGPRGRRQPPAHPADHAAARHGQGRRRPGC